VIDIYSDCQIVEFPRRWTVKLKAFVFAVSKRKEKKTINKINLC